MRIMINRFEIAYKGGGAKKMPRYQNDVVEEKMVSGGGRTMLDETYKPKPGRLSDRDIMYLCIGDKPMISPFLAKQVGKPSAGLSSSGYDLRLGAKFLRKRDYGGSTARPYQVMDVKDPDIGGMWYEDKPDQNNIIMLRPLESILTETVETIDMPDDVQALVFGKSSYARANVLVNATPLEPGWRGIVTLEIHNCDPNAAVLLYVGQGIAQAVFSRMANPPARTYSNRESGGAYQDQSGVTTSK